MTTQPTKLIVHGTYSAGPTVRGDEYHIHYTGKLVGRHFDTILVKNFGYIPQDKWIHLLGWLPTRLRVGGTVSLSWSDSL